MGSQFLPLPASDTDVSAVTAFPASAQLQAGFEPQSWAFRHTGTAGIIELSFDGVSVNARLVLGTDASSIRAVCSNRNVWARVQAAVGAGTATFEALASQER